MRVFIVICSHAGVVRQGLFRGKEVQAAFSADWWGFTVYRLLDDVVYIKMMRMNSIRAAVATGYRHCLLLEIF